MTHSDTEIKMLKKVNEIGMDLNYKSNKKFTVLAPHLLPLMDFLKKLQPEEVGQVFDEYEGVMRVMRMMEDCAQEMALV